jgi:hypothetical protein
MVSARLSVDDNLEDALLLLRRRAATGIPVRRPPMRPKKEPPEDRRL